LVEFANFLSKLRQGCDFWGLPRAKNFGDKTLAQLWEGEISDRLRRGVAHRTIIVLNLLRINGYHSPTTTQRMIADNINYMQAFLHLIFYE